MFHSAEEKRVFSIDFFMMFDFNSKELFSFTVGIKGKSQALFHLIFTFPLSVFISILSSFKSSM
jgi:hypothetical protein